MKHFALWILAFSAVVCAADKVSEIRFDQPAEGALPEKLLRYNIQQKTGQEYDRNIVAGDVKRLFNTGYFADVVTEQSRDKDNRIVLTYRVVPQPTVTRVVLDGNAKFKKEDLEKELTLPVDAPLNNAKLRESANKLREAYRGRGYNDAEITPLVVRNSDGKTVHVTFKIKENLRLKVNNVRFEGAKLFSNWTLKTSIANQHSFFSRFFETGLLERRELELDKARLRDLYWDEGYLDFKVESVKITPNADDPEYVDLDFKIFEGEPYKVGKVSIAGNKAFSTEELMGLVALKPGTRFNYRIETLSRKAISDLYESFGYADVAVKMSRNANYATHVVDVAFTIVDGRQYTVHDVVIAGNRNTKDKVIRRELAIQPGDPLDRNRIEASKARLLGMGYFEKVEAVAVNADALNEKDVQFDVTEKETFTFRVGAGFSDVNSLVGMVEISNINFDLFSPGNYFYGGGQRFRIQGVAGIERFGFNVDFSEPWLFDLPLRFDLSFYGNQLDYEYWNEQRIGVRTALTRKFFDDFTSVTVGYKFEHVRLFDFDDDAGPETRAWKGGSYVSQFSLILDRDTRDSLMMPTSGYQLNFLGAASPEIFGSTDDFYRLEFKGSYYYPFLDKALVAMVGFRMGVVSDFSSNDGSRVPLYERYFIGGGDTLRGFSYRDVAPLDSNGVPMGGSSLMIVTAEVTHPIWRFVRGAVFTDIGSVWEDAYCYDANKINIGVGYGLRIKIPQINAPIKLDLAFPVLNNQGDDSSKLRFHFNMGFTW